MINAWLKSIAGFLLACMALDAQIGKPVPVQYDALGTVEPFDPGSIKRIAWGNPGEEWSATFSFPQGWVASEFWKGPPPAVNLEVKAPDGGAQVMALPFRHYGYAFEGVNGEFIGKVKWEMPHMTFPGLHDLYYAEQATFGPWEVGRVIWRVGGCSGNPPMLFLLIVRNRESGRWRVCQDEFQYPPAPDGGDPMRARVHEDGSLGVTLWNYHGRNSAIISGWTFHARPGGEIRCEATKPRFCLFTRTGSVATLADTPREAIHIGYQEAAWHLESWNAKGGKARAFAPSPRQLLTEDARYGAPILPQPGTRRFLWAAELYVVPWKGKPAWMKLPEAQALLKTGRWDVVLFPLGEGKALCQRLVEHRRDLPHSTQGNGTRR
ncbi:hypothetical protein [Mesoterricola silvestris]|uniref:Uncharacterized protein n=1 Tax=Mesoterricola silvestris TaxID=2927979 RepID=A0AA48GJJ2_9BACT|nr:hypothetical protein [Mesoterricola silvestris]BDU74171.1 hypothetical protein METEAL_33450 [Mesoterricola silvestris]